MKKMILVTLLCMFAFAFISCSQSLSEDQVLKLAVDILDDQGKTIVDQAKWEEYQSVETISKNTEPEPSPTPTPTIEPEIGTRKNPLSIGESFTGALDCYLGNYEVEIKLTEVLTGDDALKIVKNANRYNDAPKEGQEYIIAKFSVKNVKDLTGNEAPLDLNATLFGYAKSQDVIVDQWCSIYSVEPNCDALIYEGAKLEGWVQFFAYTDEWNPTIVFNDNVWFSLKDDALSSDAANEELSSYDANLINTLLLILNSEYDGLAEFTVHETNKYFIMNYTHISFIDMAKTALDGDETGINAFNEILEANCEISEMVYDKLNYQIVMTCATVTDKRLAILESDKIIYNFVDDRE